MRILGELITELEALYAGVRRSVRAFIGSSHGRPIKTFPSMPLRKREELPTSYGSTRLVMLAVDPYTVHAYWEVTLEKLAEAESRIREWNETAQPVLRFHYSSHGDLSANQGAGRFDVNIELESRNWFVPLWSAGKSYNVELGLKTPKEQFVLLARSNVVDTPRAWPAFQVNERFMRVAEGHAEIVPAPVYRKLDPARLPLSPLAGASPRPEDVAPGAMASVELPGKPLEVHSPEGRHEPHEAENVDLSDLAGMAEKQLAAGFSSGLLRRPEH